MMQTWQVVVSHTGNCSSSRTITRRAIAYPTMHQVLNVSDTLSFGGGKIGLGSNIGQPVWDNFSFETLCIKN